MLQLSATSSTRKFRSRQRAQVLRRTLAERQGDNKQQRETSRKPTKTDTLSTESGKISIYTEKTHIHTNLSPNTTKRVKNAADTHSGTVVGLLDGDDDGVDEPSDSQSAGGIGKLSGSG